jgi:hypothetical protein
VLKAHREEKITRINSAVIVLEKGPDCMSTIPSNGGSSKGEDSIKETEEAIYKDGKVMCIKKNPLEIAADLLCPRCHKPRRLHPTTGKGARTSDQSKDYCTKQPFIDKPGFDIWGRPFPTDNMPSKGRKNKELAAAENGSSFESPAETPPDAQVEPTYFPIVKCTNCSRSLGIRRFAQHLEKCMGGKGRQSSRNAIAKMNGPTASGDTPQGSRRGTPILGAKRSPEKRDRDDDEDDEEEETLKKKKQRKMTEKSRVAKSKEPKAAKTASQESVKMAKSMSQDSHVSKMREQDNEKEADVLTVVKRKVKKPTEGASTKGKADGSAGVGAKAKLQTLPPSTGSNADSPKIKDEPKMLDNAASDTIRLTTPTKTLGGDPTKKQMDKSPLNYGKILNGKNKVDALTNGFKRTSSQISGVLRDKTRPALTSSPSPLKGPKVQSDDKT